MKDKSPKSEIITGNEYIVLMIITIILSGIAVIFIIGSSILVVRRVQGHEKAGNSTYSDWLFLFVLYTIGVTGIFLQVFRLSEIALLSYPTYFVHLVSIFVLLVFAPYSKFAHVAYRFVALLWARTNGRGQPAALLVSDILVQNPANETPVEEPAKESEATN